MFAKCVANLLFSYNAISYNAIASNSVAASSAVTTFTYCGISAASGAVSALSTIGLVTTRSERNSYDSCKYKS